MVTGRKEEKEEDVMEKRPGKRRHIPSDFTFPDIDYGLQIIRGD